MSDVTAEIIYDHASPEGGHDPSGPRCGSQPERAPTSWRDDFAAERSRMTYARLVAENDVVRQAASEALRRVPPPESRLWELAPERLRERHLAGEIDASGFYKRLSVYLRDRAAA